MPRTGDPVYEGVGMVLESTRALVPEIPGHGPQLCLGPVASSLPPQCSGPEVAGWDWGAVDGERTAGGSTWGRYVVRGTFDGTTFALTERPRPPTAGDRPAPAAPYDLSTPCAEPPGGWIRLHDDRDHEARSGAATAYANRSPDVSAVWFDADEAQAVLNVRFVRDASRHRAELRRRYSGNLCVTEGGRRMSELTSIQKRVIREIPRRNLMMAGGDVGAGHVDVQVVLDDGTLQRSFDRRFGAGVVRVSSALREVG